LHNFPPSKLALILANASGSKTPYGSCVCLRVPPACGTTAGGRDEQGAFSSLVLYKVRRLTLGQIDKRRRFFCERKNASEGRSSKTAHKTSHGATTGTISLFASFTPPRAKWREGPGHRSEVMLVCDFAHMSSL